MNVWHCLAQQVLALCLNLVVVRIQRPRQSTSRIDEVVLIAGASLTDAQAPHDPA
jgi:hypothetical protein